MRVTGYHCHPLFRATCSIVLYACCLSASAQISPLLPQASTQRSTPTLYSVSGRVISNDDKKPVPFATVYLANSLIGTTANGDGAFSLSNIPLGKYQVTVSSIGFMTYTNSILINRSFTGVVITLKTETKTLATVTVESHNAEYKKNLAIFSNYFLGQTRNSGKCEIVNPEVVDVLFDKKINTLTAVADRPIIVDNHALGYRIYYELQSFVVDFDESSYTLAGIPRFELLDSATEDKFKYAKERDRAYFGSLNHFMRSLRSDKLRANQFELYVWKRGISSARGYKTAKMTTDYHYYRANLKLINMMKNDTLLNLKIVYKGAVEEFNYKKNPKSRGYPVSYFYFLKHKLTIHENGYYDDPLDFMLGGYMGWRENVMAELLPLEYQPVFTARDVKRMAKLEELDFEFRNQVDELFKEIDDR